MTLFKFPNRFRQAGRGFVICKVRCNLLENAPQKSVPQAARVRFFFVGRKIYASFVQWPCCDIVIPLRNIFWVLRQAHQSLKFLMVYTHYTLYTIQYCTQYNIQSILETGQFFSQQLHYCIFLREKKYFNFFCLFFLLLKNILSRCTQFWAQCGQLSYLQSRVC